MPNSDIREAEHFPARRALSEETVLSLVEPEQLGKPHKVLLNHSIIKRYPPAKTSEYEAEAERLRRVLQYHNRFRLYALVNHKSYVR